MEDVYSYSGISITFVVPLFVVGIQRNIFGFWDGGFKEFECVCACVDSHNAGIELSSFTG